MDLAILTRNHLIIVKAPGNWSAGLENEKGAGVEHPQRSEQAET